MRQSHAHVSHEPHTDAALALALDAYLAAPTDPLRLSMVVDNCRSLERQAVWQRLARLRAAGVSVRVVFGARPAREVVEAFEAVFGLGSARERLAVAPSSARGRLVRQVAFGPSVWSGPLGDAHAPLRLTTEHRAAGKAVSSAAASAFHILSAMCRPVGSSPLTRWIGDLSAGMRPVPFGRVAMS